MEIPTIQFTFLGYTFTTPQGGGQARLLELLAGLDRDLKAMRQTIRGWRVQLMNDKSLADLSAMLGPILRGMAAILRRFRLENAQVGLAACERS